MKSVLAEPLTLKCGITLNNRLAKAAMTEGLADIDGVPSDALCNLYNIWSKGGAGLLISGNIQVDADHLERPGNVILDTQPSEKMAEALKNWAISATENGNQFWAQISHAGRQTMKNINPNPKAPSKVKLALPGGQFGMPEALTIEEIKNIVERFCIAAKAVVEAGFTGVQIHAAHGYLVSQFLSPKSNHRSDVYGGSLENRARFLIEIVRAVRQTVGSKIPVAVKLNSADFQKGGFEFSDSIQVLKWLENEQVDLVEISGGTYEQPKLLGIDGLEKEQKQSVVQSTSMREAYFVDFAKAMQAEVTVPLMVTGGFRQRWVMERAVADASADIIGLGRPMCVDADAAKRLLAGAEELSRYEDKLSLLPKWLNFLNKITLIRAITSSATQYWYYAQIEALGIHSKASKRLSVFSASKHLLTQQSLWIRARKEKRLNREHG